MSRELRRSDRAVAVARGRSFPAVAPGPPVSSRASGGMRQRIAIAIALACSPELLIADEPTTALDVTIQAEILDLLDELRRERGMSLILISHDLGVVADRTEEIAVMYAGRIVEQAPTESIFERMRMPYTEALFRRFHASRTRATRGCKPSLVARRIPRADPRLSIPPEVRVCAGTLCRGGPASCVSEAPDHQSRAGSPWMIARRAPVRPLEPLNWKRRHPCFYEGDVVIRTTATYEKHGDAVLRVEDLWVHFPTADPARPVQAVSDVSFDVVAGETLGLVGESGCGKSTLAKAIVQLPPPTSGRVLIDGQDMVQASGKRLRQMRPQYPDDLPGPNRVAESEADSPRDRRRTRRGLEDRPGPELEALVDATLESVGLDPAQRRTVDPDQFSGGQCQRICIARALIMDPEVIICDEAGLGARRLHPGPDPEPARGDQGAPQAHADVHLPRSGRGEEHQRPHRGDVPRQALRGDER